MICKGVRINKYIAPHWWPPRPVALIAAYTFAEKNVTKIAIADIAAKFCNFGMKRQIPIASSNAPVT